MYKHKVFGVLTKTVVHSSFKCSHGSMQDKTITDKYSISETDKAQVADNAKPCDHKTVLCGWKLGGGRRLGNGRMKHFSEVRKKALQVGFVPMRTSHIGLRGEKNVPKVYHFTKTIKYSCSGHKRKML